jgi:N-acetylneuraminic acid mutarotase
MPKGRIVVIDGVEHKAFNNKEWKQIGHLVINYRTLEDHVMELEEHNFSLLAEVELYQQRIEMWQEAIEFQEQRGDTLSTMYDQESKLRLSTYNKQKAAIIVPWTIAGVLAVACGFLGVYSATTK